MQHRAVIGIRKFYRNVSNNIDLLLVGFFTIFFFKRIGTNIAREEFLSSLPESGNTNVDNPATLRLMIDILLNVIITILTGQRLMTYLKVKATYSILI